MENLCNGALILMLVLLSILFVLLLIHDRLVISRLKKDHKNDQDILKLNLENSEKAHDLSTIKWVKLREEYNLLCSERVKEIDDFKERLKESEDDLAAMTELYKQGCDIISALEEDNESLQHSRENSIERFKEMDVFKDRLKESKAQIETLLASKNKALNERDEALRNYKGNDAALKTAMEAGSKVVAANKLGHKELARVNKELLEAKEYKKKFIGLQNGNNSCRRYVKGMSDYEGKSIAFIVKDLVKKIKYGK
jgi:chromosome segregation ATPase